MAVWIDFQMAVQEMVVPSQEMVVVAARWMPAEHRRAQMVVPTQEMPVEHHSSQMAVPTQEMPAEHQNA